MDKLPLDIQNIIYKYLHQMYLNDINKELREIHFTLIHALKLNDVLEELRVRLLV
jgi:hypothetical protein